MKNKPIIHILLLVAAMLLNIAAFICILLFLDILGNTLHIALTFLSLLLFCFLGAKLLLVVLSTGSSRITEVSGKASVACKDTTVLSSQGLVEKLLNSGFVEADASSGSVRFYKKSFITRDRI